VSSSKDQEFFDFASEVLSIAERVSGFRAHFSSSLATGLFLGPEDRETLAIECFKRLAPDFEYTKGELTYVSNLRTVEELVRYFDDLLEGGVGDYRPEYSQPRLLDFLQMNRLPRSPLKREEVVIKSKMLS